MSGLVIYFKTYINKGISKYCRSYITGEQSRQLHKCRLVYNSENIHKTDWAIPLSSPHNEQLRCPSPYVPQ